MFTQRQIADAFSITPQAVTMLLRGVPPALLKMSQLEGGRAVGRIVKAYSEESVFNIAVKTGKLPAYHSLCRSAGIEPRIFHVSKKEVVFGERLRQFLPECFSIFRQYQVESFRIDFYVPEANLAIEYDELHHNLQYNQCADAERQASIEESTGAIFVRVKEGMEDQGLFNIASVIIRKSPM